MALALEPDSTERHRTVPIRNTITHIPGYPRKLVIFMIPASSYWWVRYYFGERIFKRTTKTDIKRDAIEAAKRFYDDVNLRVRAGEEPLPKGVNAAEVMTFSKMTTILMDAEKAKVDRKQLSLITYDNMQYRYNKTILPFLGQKDIATIQYPILDEFLKHLSSQAIPLSVSTISSYMGLVRKVLQHAARYSYVKHVPEFPKVGVEDKPRGYFQVQEYEALYKAAKKIAGKKVEWRKHTTGEGSYFCEPKMRLEPGDKLIRNIEMTWDFADLIVFMVNSYIRPTDIKNMQYQHVDVVKTEGREYLRLRLPPSKGHSFPITTMPYAVKVFERLCRRRKPKDANDDFKIMPNEYVFLPEIKNRDYALKQLQRQFEVLLEMTGLSAKGSDENRTLYSLRHTSIMYRLMFGDGIDTLTLARNARTSPEMIDRFYAAPLQGEMNIEKLQSKRHPRIWEQGYKPEKPDESDKASDKPKVIVKSEEPIGEYEQLLQALIGSNSTPSPMNQSPRLI